MTKLQKTFTEKRDKYIAILKDGIVTVRIGSDTAKGNSTICGVYNINEHRWYNDSGRKVLPYTVRNKIEQSFRPIKLDDSN